MSHFQPSPSAPSGYSHSFPSYPAQLSGPRPPQQHELSRVERNRPTNSLTNGHGIGLKSDSPPHKNQSAMPTAAQQSPSQSSTSASSVDFRNRNDALSINTKEKNTSGDVFASTEHDSIQEFAPGYHSQSKETPFAHNGDVLKNGAAPTSSKIHDLVHNDIDGSPMASLNAKPKEGGTKRKKKKVPDPIEDPEGDARRKTQNRAAQRAFRERKEQHVRDLEERMTAQQAQLVNFRDMIEELQTENEALRRGEKVAKREYTLPVIQSYQQLDFTDPSQSDQPAGKRDSHESSSNSPIASSLSDSRLNSSKAMMPEESESTSSVHSDGRRILKNEDTDVDQNSDNFEPVQKKLKHETISAPKLPTDTMQSEAAGNLNPTISPSARQAVVKQENATSASNPMASASSNEAMDIINYEDDAMFDFNRGTFDFADTVPLPPLFENLFAQSFSVPGNYTPLGGTPGDYSQAPYQNIAPDDDKVTSTQLVQDREEEDENDDDCSSIEEDDSEAPPVNGKIHCGKPECDFSVISCNLPIPWRPPAIDSSVPTKDAWVATQAWAKLCSHPEFAQCDVDELCRELRDKAKCSNDGRVVVCRTDVCVIFKSIPARAKLRRLQQEAEGEL